MFQLWKFVLLCGLLAGTSANIVEKLTEVDNLKPLVEGVLETIQSKSLFPKHHAAFPGTATRGCALWVVSH